MSLISIRNLRKEYPDIVPLAGVSVDIEEGEVISIIGPSGTGKSTLLRCINRLETPTSGSVIVDGIDVCAPDADLTALRKSMGMVFQSFNLFPHKMVVENIMLPQQSLLGKSPEEAYREAMEQLNTVGLADKARKYPDELSGGQKQRVAIARALAMHPKILLFDEPTSALDPAMVSEVLSVIRRLAGTGLTMLIVTHEMRLARNVSDRVLFMSGGGIYEEGTPEQIFGDPVREGTRNFIFRIHTWEWTLSSEEKDVYGMLGSLEEFCRDQFLGRKEAMNCQLAVEELTASVLLPAVGSPHSGSFRLVLNTGEEETGSILTIDHSGIRGGEALFRDFPIEAVPDGEAAPGQTREAAPRQGPGRGAADSARAASAAILTHTMERLPDPDEKTAAFRIL